MELAESADEPYARLLRLLRSLREAKEMEEPYIDGRGL